MREERTARALWERALEALKAANALVELAPDDAASRAYYAAFHAVSALFALEGRSFRKHSAVLAAVHKELARTGRWELDIVKKYKRLGKVRETGDYGGGLVFNSEEAALAVEDAADVLRRTARECPEIFRWIEP